MTTNGLLTSAVTDYGLEDDASFCSASTTSHQQPYLMSGALQNKSTISVSHHHRDQQPYHSNTNNISSLSFVAAPPREIQPQHQNWLMKFLRIKPAVTVIPFQVSRIRARKEIVAVLREWKRYGMRDIVVDKEKGRVWARVGVKNCESKCPHLFLLFLGSFSRRSSLEEHLTDSRYPQPSTSAPSPSPWKSSPCSSVAAKPTSHSHGSRRKKAQRAPSSASSRPWRIS